MNETPIQKSVIQPKTIPKPKPLDKKKQKKEESVY